LGLTWVRKQWNAKLLYGRAFRVPLLYQAYSRQFSASSLVPEIASTFDLELGYKTEQGSYLRVNVFHTNIEKPITYIGANNAYQNFGEVRSVGMEVEARKQGKGYQCFANFSYARPLKRATTPDFMNGGNDAFLALPTMKANAGGSVSVGKTAIGSTLTWIGERYAQTQYSALNSSPTALIRETSAHSALFLWNMNIVFKEFFSSHVSLRLNAYNILNAPYVVLQPYYGGHAPMPVGDRQVDAMVMIRF
jgi:outer membrane cobalamin receptor